jgi:hypothetical protein
MAANVDQGFGNGDGPAQLFAVSWSAFGGCPLIAIATSLPRKSVPAAIESLIGISAPLQLGARSGLAEETELLEVRHDVAGRTDPISARQLGVALRFAPSAAS